MSWTQVSPGRYRRPLDGMERFFATVAALGAPREPFSITVTVKVKLDLEPHEARTSALRHAWKTIRYDFPQIASKIKEGDDMTKVYEMAKDPSAIEAWLAETFVVELDETTTVSDLIATFQPRQLATLHYLPHSSELVLHSSHWRIDGVSALYLLDRFFRAVVEPREICFGEEAVRLSPSLEQAIPMRLESTPETDQAAEALLRDYVSHLPSVGPKTTDAILPGGTRTHSLRFSESETVAILEDCKARGFGIAAATHAALVVATHTLAPASTAGRLPYTSFCRFNLRPYLCPAFRTSAHAVALYTCSLPISLPQNVYSNSRHNITGKSLIEMLIGFQEDLKIDILKETGSGNLKAVEQISEIHSE